MKRIFAILIIILCLFKTPYAHAFFTENYKKKMLYGAFKNEYNADLYLGIRAGFIVNIWTPNVITSILGNESAINQYRESNTADTNWMQQKTKGKYSYSIGIDIGLHTHGSILRHELNFEWYGIVSNDFNIGISANTANLNGTIYTYRKIAYDSNNSKSIISLGTYANIYKFMYSLYFNFDNVFSFLGPKWDVFIGFGCGLALISGGTYLKEEIQSEDSYVNNNVSTSSKAEKNSFTSSKTFGVAYQIKIGALANLSQSFALNVAFTFGATSRPLLTTNLHRIEGYQGSQAHLEYHLALEIGLFLKAFQLYI